MEEKEKLVSVVIPVYNGARYIRGCVKFLKKQTWKNLDIIFVDDGSSDGSGEVCERECRDDTRFRVLRQENGGTARARNTGLATARGEYITFLDVDDEYAPEMIEKLALLIEAQESDLAVCGYYFKIEAGEGEHARTRYLEKKNYPPRIFQDFSELKREYIAIWDADMFSNVWNKLYRMETIRKYGMRFRDGHVYTEDRVFNRLFLSKSGRVALTDECLYYYIREREGSTTEKYRDDAFVIRDKEYREFKAHFKEMGIWNEESREYTSREFIERIAGCIENVFHAGRRLSVRRKYQIIREMILHEDTREAVRYARHRSRKMRLFAAPIRMKWTAGAYVMGMTIYLIRRCSPAAFHKLKSMR